MAELQLLSLITNEEDTETPCAQTRKVARQRVIQLNDRRCNQRMRSHREAELRLLSFVH